MTATLFTNAKILTMSEATSPTLIDGCVGVVGNRIALVSQCEDMVAQFRSMHPSLRVIDCGDKLLMPGLINTHTHCAMTLERGTGDDTELMKWLNQIVWPFEAKQTPEDIEAGARLSIAEMLLGGTTTFVDMYWEEASIARAAESMGIRAVLGESCLDLCMDQFEERLPRLLKSVEGCSRLKAAIAPHAPYTCSPTTLERCTELADLHSLPLIIHLAETEDETTQIKERYGSTPTEYVDRCGVLRPTTVLAHGIYLSPSDIDIIKGHGSHIAHCPQSNMKLASGVSPVTELLGRGVNVCIATDGSCSNNDVDLWDELRTASFLQKLTTGSATSLGAYQALQMATVNGAKVVGEEGSLGVIAEGALADIIVVDTLRPHYRPRLNLVSSMIYCSHAGDVDIVMVDGRILVEDHRLLFEDVERLCLDVEERSRKILESL